MKLWTVLLAGVLTLGALEAEAARRLGGGGSVGRQSSNVTQRQASPPPATPTAPANAAQQRQAAPPAATPAAQPRSRWGGMLGGLAAGLGLAWLANALGFGEAFANILMFGLLALGVMLVIGMVMRKRAGGPAARPGPYAYQGAGAGPDAATAPRQYSPDKVGNDASARPWERNSTAFDAGRYNQGGGVKIGSGLAGSAPALEGSQDWGVPPGFDTAGFLAAAKRNFVTLQDAWDRSDLQSLRSMMTDTMLREIGAQLAERDRQPKPAAGARTAVEMLEAQLLGIEDTGGEYLASVEFSGMIREDPTVGPAPFREVWNMSKPKDGSAGWLVAGVQALQ
jgi:predicted lipid-binding transport protein (Tim44 family)